MSDKSLTVVCGLVFSGKQVLATRRDPARSFPLLWEFPGGKVENGENPGAALHRELEEELAFKVRIVRQLEPQPFSMAGLCLNLLPFLCQPDQEWAPVPHDHAEIRWVTPQEASTLQWAPADLPLVRRLSEFLQAVAD